MYINEYTFDKMSTIHCLVQSSIRDMLVTQSAGVL